MADALSLKTFSANEQNMHEKAYHLLDSEGRFILTDATLQQVGELDKYIKAIDPFMTISSIPAGIGEFYVYAKRSG